MILDPVIRYKECPSNDNIQQVLMMLKWVSEEYHTSMEGAVKLLDTSNSGVLMSYPVWQAMQKASFKEENEKGE